ncbi:MAG: NIL domain-containing protein, partial [Lawsonibacter sp.]
GITVVVITHQMSVVEEICNHVAILDNGSVVETGDVAAVFSSPRSEAAKRLVFPEESGTALSGNLGERVIRVVFRGALAANAPLITQMAMDEGIAANILYASTRSIGEKVYGNMLLGLPDEEAILQRAKGYLSRTPNILVEEVEPHA